MKAIIRLDVPEWQIGTEVTVYFKDTMMQRGICEADTDEQKSKLNIEENKSLAE